MQWPFELGDKYSIYFLTNLLITIVVNVIITVVNIDLRNVRRKHNDTHFNGQLTGQPVPECQTILDFAAARDEEVVTIATTGILRRAKFQSNYH